MKVRDFLLRGLVRSDDLSISHLLLLITRIRASVALRIRLSPRETMKGRRRSSQATLNTADKYRLIRVLPLYSSSTTGLGRGEETVTCVILSSGARRASNTTD
jgi:hypothetical protein